MSADREQRIAAVETTAGLYVEAHRRIARRAGWEVAGALVAAGIAALAFVVADGGLCLGGVIAVCLLQAMQAFVRRGEAGFFRHAWGRLLTAAQLRDSEASLADLEIEKATLLELDWLVRLEDLLAVEKARKG